MTAPNGWAGSKLLTAVRAVLATCQALKGENQNRPLTRTPWLGLQRQHPELAAGLDRLAAAAPPDDMHLGHMTLARMFAPTGGPAFPYVALAFALGESLEPTIVAFRLLKSLDDPAGLTFVGEHASPENQRTVLLCAVMGGA